MGCVTIDPITTNLDGTVLEGAVALLSCLETSLGVTVAGPVCRACIYPGAAVPMDYCSTDSECASGAHGMAAVRVAGIQLMADQAATNCTFFASQIAVTYEMTVVRCAHTIQAEAGQVVLPTCDELASDTAILLDDAAAMRAALKCCYAARPRGGGCSPRVTAVGLWSPRGPAGGCVGGQMQFTVVLNDCSCPP